MKLAAIDIGSNSVHMIIVKVSSDHSFEIVDRERDMIKLGAGSFRTGRLDADAAEMGLLTLARYKKLAERFGVDEIIAVATSAVREAVNGGDFLDALKQRTGIVAEVVSGEEEARLIYLAVRHAIDLSARRALIVDAGGGSVEVTVGDARTLAVCEHLKLGVQRLRDLFGREDPLPAKARRALEAYVRERAEPVLARARQAGFDLVVGTSGSIHALGLAASLRRGRDPWISPNGQAVPAAEIRDLAERLAQMDAAGRARVPGIDEQRADTIHLAAILFSTILDLAKAESITLCDCALREGALLDYLARARDRILDEESIPDIRRRSVLDLARRSGQAGAHGEHVGALALQIFDQTRALHGLGEGPRRLLEYAALVHDVGKHIGFERHEHHGYYMIRNADLRGFADGEVEMVALLARYHRKAEPKKKHAELAGLPKKKRHEVQLLAGILRVAEGLDRSQFQVVEGVRVEVEPPTGGEPERVRIVAIAAGDAELEVWSARRKARLLARALEREVEVVHGDAGRGATAAAGGAARGTGAASRPAPIAEAGAGAGATLDTVANAGADDADDAPPPTDGDFAPVGIASGEAHGGEVPVP